MRSEEWTRGHGRVCTEVRMFSRSHYAPRELMLARETTTNDGDERRRRTSLHIVVRTTVDIMFSNCGCASQMGRRASACAFVREGTRTEPNRGGRHTRHTEHRTAHAFSPLAHQQVRYMMLYGARARASTYTRLIKRNAFCAAETRGMFARAFDI